MKLLSGESLADVLDAVLVTGAAFRFRVAGYSMTPTIRDGDIVVISPFKHLPPRVGEIVAFRHPHNRRLVIHRFLGMDHSLALCRGDNRDRFDDPVPEDLLAGVVTTIERGGKRRMLPDRFARPRLSRWYCLLDLHAKRVRRLAKRLIVRES